MYVVFVGHVRCNVLSQSVWWINFFPPFLFDMNIYFRPLSSCFPSPFLDRRLFPALPFRFLFIFMCFCISFFLFLSILCKAHSPPFNSSFYYISIHSKFFLPFLFHFTYQHIYSFLFCLFSPFSFFRPCSLHFFCIHLLHSHFSFLFFFSYF